MIMMWLGPVAMMIGSFIVFRFGVGQCLEALQKRFLTLPESTSMFKMMATTKLCVLSQGSFIHAQYSAVALLNSRGFSKHYAVLLLCLSGVGFWTTMVGVLAAWQISGEILLTAAFAVYLYSRWTGKGLGFFKLIAGLGGFLTGAQWVMQKHSILLSVLGESEFHFLLADGRFPAQLLWLLVAFSLTLVIGIESWAIFVALVLLVAGSLSLNGAVAIVIGEILAHVWVLWWRSRKLNQDVQTTVKAYAVASTLGLVMAFFAAGVLRDAFAWSFTFEGNPLTEKSWQFLSMYLLIVMVQTLTVLMWGHFAAQKKFDEVQKGEYFSVQWISRGVISPHILDFILNKLNERLELLQAQQKELDTKDRAQIPAAFLKVHEHEIAQLSLWLPLAAQSSDKKKI